MKTNGNGKLPTFGLFNEKMLKHKWVSPARLAGGNLLEDKSRYVANGHILLLTKAIAPLFRSVFQIRNGDARKPASARKAAKLMTSLIATSTTKVQMKRLIIQEDVTGKLVVSYPPVKITNLDAEYHDIVVTTTGADSLHYCKKNPCQAWVYYKNNKPVAALMPRMRTA